MLLLLLACTVDPSDDDAPAVDSADDSADDTAACELPADVPPEKYAGEDPRPARWLDGRVTWTLDFDAEAEATGYRDCTYTRVYPTFVEVTDEGWLCPTCTLQVQGTAVMTEGYDDCYLQIDDGEAERTEQLGLGLVDGALHLFRAGSDNVTLGDAGAVVGDEAAFEAAWESEGTLETGGGLLLSASGAFTAGVSEEETVDDPARPRAEPYACGWPLMSPGGPVTDWTIHDGGVLPNGRFEDACGEGVDLWDFRGRYVVIDASSPDCGPCQAMAALGEAFKAQMAEECLPVELLTLLNAGLRAVNLPAEPAVVDAWVETFGLTSPVLADRGWGYALMPPYLRPGESGMSLPSVIVVAPDGTVIGGGSGFYDDPEVEALDGWEPYAAIIRAHAGR